MNVSETPALADPARRQQACQPHTYTRTVRTGVYNKSQASGTGGIKGFTVSHFNQNDWLLPGMKRGGYLHVQHVGATRTVNDQARDGTQRAQHQQGVRPQHHSRPAHARRPAPPDGRLAPKRPTPRGSANRVTPQLAPGPHKGSTCNRAVPDKSADGPESAVAQCNACV